VILCLAVLVELRLVADRQTGIGESKMEETEREKEGKEGARVIVVKFEEMNLKFKKFVKVRDPHSVTAASRSHSLL